MEAEALLEERESATAGAENSVTCAVWFLFGRVVFVWRGGLRVVDIVVTGACENVHRHPYLPEVCSFRFPPPSFLTSFPSLSLSPRHTHLHCVRDQQLRQQGDDLEQVVSKVPMGRAGGGVDGHEEEEEKEEKKR
jgi:hypothetical protein